MELGCGSKCIKYFMVFFNFVFFVLGIVIFGVGIYARIKQDDFDAYFVVVNESNATWENFGSICIAVGVFVMLLGGSGCYGAYKHNRGCLAFFTFLVFLVFLMEIVAAGIGYHYRGSLEDSIHKNMNRTLNESFYQTDSQQPRKSWKIVEEDLTCCGVDSFMDYNITGHPVPQSCGAPGKYETRHGCYYKVKDALTGKWGAWAGGAIGIAFIQLISMVAAVLLFRELGKEGKYEVV